jgi:hypothetical protein
VPLLVLCSCKKWEDPKAQDDPRINERRYCNDPLAVNYNWNFPGKPDNTTCFYPTDVFKGTYLFKDSVYKADNTFDSARSLTTYTLNIFPFDKNHFAIVGFCGANDSLKFTAERSTYRANGDSTILMANDIKAYGQFFCRTQDTLSGYLIKDRSDSSKLLVEFAVLSDTGLNFHRGTAIKQ